jgi:hypothetical protein
MATVIQAVSALTPGASFPKRALLACGQVMRIGLLVGRKVRVMRKKENRIPLAVGYALNAGIQLCPPARRPMQYAAKIVFGSLSIVRCSEDLVEIKSWSQRAIRCIKGVEYVTIKKDDWSRANFKRRTYLPSEEYWIWFRRVYTLQLKQAFICIGHCFKRLGMLAMHLTDACTAYTDQHVAEIVVYSKDLWLSLTQNDAILVKELKRTGHVTDWMLGKRGSPWTTALMLNLFAIPARIQEKLPDVRDLQNAAKNRLEQTAIRIAALEEECNSQRRQFLAQASTTEQPRFIPTLNRRYRIFSEGSVQDPNTMRFIVPPRLDLKFHQYDCKIKTF